MWVLNPTVKFIFYRNKNVLLTQDMYYFNAVSIEKLHLPHVTIPLIEHFQLLRFEVIESETFFSIKKESKRKRKVTFYNQRKISLFFTVLKANQLFKQNSTFILRISSSVRSHRTWETDTYLQEQLITETCSRLCIIQIFFL